MLVCEGLELLDEVAVKVLDNVDMRLHNRFRQRPSLSTCLVVGQAHLYAAAVGSCGVCDPEQALLRRDVDRDAEVGPLPVADGEELLRDWDRVRRCSVGVRAFRDGRHPQLLAVLVG